MTTLTEVLALMREAGMPALPEGEGHPILDSARHYYGEGEWPAGSKNYYANAPGAYYELAECEVDGVMHVKGAFGRIDVDGGNREFELPKSQAELEAAKAAAEVQRTPAHFLPTPAESKARKKRENNKKKPPVDPDNAPMAPDPPPDGGNPTANEDERPIIFWKEGALPDIVDQAEQAMLHIEMEPMYQRAGQLVRAAKKPALTIRNYKRKAGALGLIPLDRYYLVEMMQRAALWKKFDARSEVWRPMTPPERAAVTYLSRSGHWKVPALRATISTPTLRPDMTVLQDPGYDEATQLLFDPCGVEFPRVPDKPTREDAEAALIVLEHAFDTLPFVGAVDQSVALALVFSGLVRRSLPSCPLGGITAPVARTGKTLLADCISILAMGIPAPAMKFADNDEEAAKTALAILLEGDSVVLIDNVQRALEGDWLCSMLTSEQYSQRALGVNVMMKVSTTTLFLATGNHLAIAGDLAARALLCQVDPKVEKPEERKFDHELRVQIMDRRPELVSAALTIMRAFAVSGVKAADIKLAPWGGFEEWSSMVRAPLVWMNQEDPCKSRKLLQAQDPDRAELMRFLVIWRKEFKDEKLTAREVCDRADLPLGIAGSETLKPLRDILSEIAMDRTTRQLSVRRLTRWIKNHSDRPASTESGVLQFVKAGEHDHVILWKVEVMDTS